MSKITLYRKSNLMLMVRKFKILIDGKEHGVISNGEEIEVEIPPDADELHIKIMNYVSKPIKLNQNESGKYVVTQSVLSTLTTYGMILFGGLFFIFKFVLDNHQPIFLYTAMPFFILSIFYSTAGRNNVILVTEEEEPADSNAHNDE